MRLGIWNIPFRQSPALGARTSTVGTMILKVHLDGVACYDVGEEIWQESLADAMHAEAETIASYA